MERKCLKVMYVVHSLDVGGTERLIYEMVEAISKHDIEPMVACLDRLGVWGEKLRSAGFKVFDLGRMPGVDIGVSGRLRDLIINEAPDVVNPHQYTPYFYTILAIILMPKRPKIVFTEHGRFYPDKVRPKRVIFNQLANLFTDEIIGVSEFSKRALVKYEWFPESRIKVIYNGIKTENFLKDIDIPSKRKSIGLFAEDIVIGAVGRLCVEKNYPMLIQAAKLVCEKEPKTRFVIVGGGELESELKALAAQLGLEEKVIFLGARQDVPELLKIFDILALSSDSEGASLVLLEAMASGLPVVTTSVGGSPELIIDGETGMLIPCGDHQRFSEALLYLARDAGIRKDMGEAAKHHVNYRFSFNEMLKKYILVYKSALKRIQEHPGVANSENIITDARQMLNKKEGVPNARIVERRDRVFSTIYELVGDRDGGSRSYILKVNSKDTILAETEFNGYRTLEQKGLRCIEPVGFSTEYNYLITNKMDGLKDLNDILSHCKDLGIKKTIFTKIGAVLKVLEVHEKLIFNSIEYNDDIDSRFSRICSIRETEKRLIKDQLKILAKTVKGKVLTSALVTDFSLGNIHINSHDDIVLVDMADFRVSSFIENFAIIYLEIKFGKLGRFFDSKEKTEVLFEAFLQGYGAHSFNKTEFILYLALHLLNQILFLEKISASENNIVRRIILNFDIQRRKHYLMHILRRSDHD